MMNLDAFFSPYLLWAKSLCTPVFWRDANQHMHNGTMTFLRTQSHVLGVTNTHVADGLANCSEESGTGCQIGGARLDPVRLIAHHPTMDLATFRLSDIMLATAGHSAATVSKWPPDPPSVGDVVMCGGYPAIYREERAGKIDFTFACFVGKVGSVSDRHIGMVLNQSRKL